MKNIQPLEVTPMLGSAPSSPTSLKTKSIANGSPSIANPSGPVTKVPTGIVGSSIGACFFGSSSRQPAVLIIMSMKQIPITLKSNFILVNVFGVTIITFILNIPKNQF